MRERSYFPAAGYLPPGAKRMFLSTLGNEKGYIDYYNLKHYCKNCDEVMNRAWGDSCPICQARTGRVWKREEV